MTERSRSIEGHRAGGFTLVELMVTIAVLVILTTLAVPAMNNILENRRLVGAGQAIYEQIQFARTEAIKQSRNIFVVAEGGDDWCVAVSDDGDCDCSVTDVTDGDACTLIAAVGGGGQAERILRRVVAADHRTITMPTPANGTTIEFNFVRGTVAQGAGANIVVESPRGLQRTAQVNIVGQIITGQ